jgi:K+-sensing histidine kinase KdpD
VRQDRALAAGYVTAAAGPLAAVSLLSVFREQPLSIPAVVLLLVVVIVIAATLAGPVAGLTATLTAALSFDFLFVTPYRVLKLGPIEKVWPVALLLATGVSIGFAVQQRWPYRDGAVGSGSQRASSPSLHVHRVALLIEQGADGRDVIAAVQAELTGLLVARSCRFDAGQDPTRRPRLERDGTVSGYGAEPVLPATELELPVQRGRHRVGSFVIDPTPGVIVPFDHRIVAVILTDHLAAALAARKPAPPRV